jgi:hypothetical protein
MSVRSAWSILSGITQFDTKLGCEIVAPIKQMDDLMQVGFVKCASVSQRNLALSPYCLSQRAND